MTMYSGDEYYDDDVTSGPIVDDEVDDLASMFSDVEQGRYDDDPNPYHGDYSED